MKKNKNNRSIFSLEGNGELTYHVNDQWKALQKADTPLDHPIIPFIVMALCGAVDLAVFYSLFSSISYDDLAIVKLQCVGLFIGFDVVPIYLGIQLRRQKQKLAAKGDRFLFWIGLTAVLAAVLINVVLRIATARSLTPSGVLDAETISQTIFACLLPLVTSLGSTYVSYACYDPLRIRKHRLERAISEKSNAIRRLEALRYEYDADKDYARQLIDGDDLRFNATWELEKAMIGTYATYVRQRLMQVLSDPAAVSALSAYPAALLERLDRAAAAYLNVSKKEGDTTTKAQADVPAA